jgi:hypothetical protein
MMRLLSLTVLSSQPFRAFFRSLLEGGVPFATDKMLLCSPSRGGAFPDIPCVTDLQADVVIPFVANKAARADSVAIKAAVSKTYSMVSHDCVASTVSLGHQIGHQFTHVTITVWSRLFLPRRTRLHF